MIATMAASMGLPPPQPSASSASASSSAYCTHTSVEDLEERARKARADADKMEKLVNQEKDAERIVPSTTATKRIMRELKPLMEGRLQNVTCSLPGDDCYRWHVAMRFSDGSRLANGLERYAARHGVPAAVTLEVISLIQTPPLALALTLAPCITSSPIAYLNALDPGPSPDPARYVCTGALYGRVPNDPAVRARHLAAFRVPHGPRDCRREHLHARAYHWGWPARLVSLDDDGACPRHGTRRDARRRRRGGRGPRRCALLIRGGEGCI